MSRGFPLKTFAWVYFRNVGRRLWLLRWTGSQRPLPALFLPACMASETVPEDSKHKRKRQPKAAPGRSFPSGPAAFGCSCTFRARYLRERCPRTVSAKGKDRAKPGGRALPALILPVCMTSETCPRTASAREKDRAKPGGRAPRCDFLFSIRRILPI